MSWPRICERLVAGEHVKIRPTGNSMTPRIKSKDLVTIRPWPDPNGRYLPLEEGMIALAKVKGRYYLHLVSRVTGDRVQISNNHGHVNGWTTKSKVYGIVTEIE